MVFTFTLNKLFNYINENLLDDEDARKIPEECLIMFRQMVHIPLEQKLIEAIFEAVNRDRDNEQIDRPAVISVMNSFKTLIVFKKPKTMMQEKVLVWSGIRNKNYTDSMAPMFMKMTNQYYENKG